MNLQSGFDSSREPEIIKFNNDSLHVFLVQSFLMRLHLPGRSISSEDSIQYLC